MTAWFRILLLCSVAGAALAIVLGVQAYFGHTHWGVLTIPNLLMGMCALWVMLIGTMPIAGLTNKARFRQAFQRLPNWVGVVVVILFLLDIVNGFVLTARMPGASNAQLSDFRDSVSVQAWSFHTVFMYGMAYVFSRMALKARG